MTLTLVRARLRPADLARWAGERGWATWRGRGGAETAHFDEGAALHHLLGETFGKGALQPFRFLVPPRARQGSLYAYAGGSLADLRETARSAALPEVLRVVDPDEVEAKEMPVDWRAGQRLGFDVKLRPVVRLKRSLPGFKAGAEVDAFLAEALRCHPENPAGMAEEDRLREKVYCDWFAARLGGTDGSLAAARLEPGVRLVRFRRVRSARGGRAVEGPEAVMQGTLTVLDPAEFARRLRRGVGRHCAYGYGMLLLRPPGTPVPAR